MAYDFNSLTKQAAEASNRDGFYTDFSDVDPNKLHQISELTNWMRTKGKGSDVREVIAQLFERTWVESIKEGNANLEVAKARGSYGTLGERLNQSDQSVGNLFGKVATHSSQIENIIASAGDGTLPTELVDIRTLSSGKTYPTAGEATRAIDEKIKDMPKTIKNIITNVQVGKYWSNRTIGQDGTELKNHADYTAYTIPVTPGSIISSNIEMVSPYSHFLDASKKSYQYAR